jgi:hypothetical protein
MPVPNEAPTYDQRDQDIQDKRSGFDAVGLGSLTHRSRIGVCMRRFRQCIDGARRRDSPLIGYPAEFPRAHSCCQQYDYADCGHSWTDDRRRGAHALGRGQGLHMLRSRHMFARFWFCPDTAIARILCAQPRRLSTYLSVCQEGKRRYVAVHAVSVMRAGPSVSPIRR